MTKNVINSRLFHLIGLSVVALVTGGAAGQDAPQPLLQLTPPANHSFQDAAINLDRAQIVSVGTSTAVLWDINGGAGKPTVNLPNGKRFEKFRPNGKIISPNGQFAIEYWIATSKSGRWRTAFSLWDLFANKKILTNQSADAVPIFSSNSELIAYPEWNSYRSAKEKQSIKLGLIVVDLTSRKKMKTEPVAGGFSGNALGDQLSFTADASRIVAIQALEGRNKKRATVWNVADLAPVMQLDFDGFRPTLAFSHDGKYLLINGLGKQQIYDVESGDVVSTFEGKQIRGLRFYEFNPERDQVAGKDVAGNVYFWDWKRQILTALPAQDEPVKDLVYSPDGKTLATTEMDQDWANLWDVGTRQRIARLPTQVDRDQYVTAKFSGDGKQLLTFSASELNVWDVARLRESFLPDIAGRPQPDPRNLAGNAQRDPMNRERAVGQKANRETDEPVAAGQLRLEWAPILNAIPSGVNNIAIYRHADMLQGELISSKIPPDNRDRLAEDLAGAFQPSAAQYVHREWATDKSPEYVLLGYFDEVKNDGSQGIYVEFALSDRPLNFESIKQHLKGSDFRNRQFKGEEYIAGASGKTAAYMPDSRTLFVGQTPADIEAIIMQLHQKPSNLAHWVNRELSENQFLVLVSRLRFRAIFSVIWPDRPRDEEWQGLAKRQQVELLDKIERNKIELDSLEQLQLTGSFSENAGIKLSFEFADAQNASNALNKVEFHRERFSKILSQEKSPTLVVLDRLLEFAKPKVTDRFLTLTTDVQAVKKVLEKLLQGLSE